VEALVEPSVLRLFQERGIQVIDTAQRLKTTKNGEQMEIDILATNEDSVIVIEVKTTLKVEDVNYFIEKLSRFFEFFPKYKGMKLYGAVAGIRIEEMADRYAYRKGLFVLTLSGEGMVVILSPE
jgi:Holliday junction resolvase